MSQTVLPVLLVLMAPLLQLLPAAEAQQNFTSGPVPDFTLGIFYPARSPDPVEAEVAACRTITDRIERNSARFNSELVTSTNPSIAFSTPDSRLMSSRIQTHLDALASSYSSETGGRRMTILKAWTPYPDWELAAEPKSLHYEGGGWISSCWLLLLLAVKVLMISGRTVQVQLSQESDYPRFLEQAVESSFDWVYYASRDHVRLSVTPSNCATSADVVFVLDDSESTEANHLLVLQFIARVASSLGIGLNSTRVGVVTSSLNSEVQFDLDDHTTPSSLLSTITNISFQGGPSNISAALSTARTLLDPTSDRGARRSFFGIPKIAVLITDGVTSPDNTDVNDEAAALRESGVQVYTVGIGGVDLNELSGLSSDPDNQYVFVVSNFSGLAGLVNYFSAAVCDAPAVIEINPPKIPDGGIRYFQTECPTSTDKVIVELADVSGTSFLYSSAIETNPGPLTPNTVRNETAGIRYRTAIVPLTSSSKVVYIGVQGQMESDLYTLTACREVANVSAPQVTPASPSPPRLTATPEDISASEGDMVAFTCIAMGVPAPTIRWFRGSTQVGEGETLTLEDVSGDDAGTYTCRASNGVGADVAASGQLTVSRSSRVLPSVLMVVGSTLALIGIAMAVIVLVMLSRSRRLKKERGNAVTSSEIGGVAVGQQYQEYNYKQKEETKEGALTSQQSLLSSSK